MCCVTYGAGGLNMIDAVACAYAEESPLVLLKAAGRGASSERADMPAAPRSEDTGVAARGVEESPEYAAILDDPVRPRPIRKAPRSRQKPAGRSISKSRATWSRPTIDVPWMSSSNLEMAATGRGRSGARNHRQADGRQAPRAHRRRRSPSFRPAGCHPGRALGSRGVISRPRRVSHASSEFHQLRIWASSPRRRCATSSSSRRCCCLASWSAIRASACPRIA